MRCCFFKKNCPTLVIAVECMARVLLGTQVAPEVLLAFLFIGPETYVIFSSMVSACVRLTASGIPDSHAN